MSNKKANGEVDEFEEIWIDVNGFTAKEWDEIRSIARALRDKGNFKGDSFKCTIGAFVLWVSEGNGLRDEDDAPAPDGTLLN